MAYTVKKPREIVDDAVAGRLDIPEFQRGFKWSPGKVRDLLDSLWRDYPVGQMLTWLAPDYLQPRSAHGVSRDRLWVVDGQQRTTALCLLFGKKPYWYKSPGPWNDAMRRHQVLVNLDPLRQEPEFGLANPIRLKTPTWVSVREILGLGGDKAGKLDKTKLKAEIRALARQLMKKLDIDESDIDSYDAIATKIESVLDVCRREIAVVSVGHELEDVAEIFARLNQAGTRVNEADVTLGLIAARQPGWVRDHFIQFQDDLAQAGYGLDASRLVRSFTAIWLGKARLRDVPRRIWNATKEFTRGWTACEDSVRRTVRFLSEQGILTSDLLPSSNVLVTLFALDHKFCRGDRQHLAKCLHWALLATWDGRYSGSAISTIDQDITVAHTAAGLDEALETLRRPLRVPSEVSSQDMLADYRRARFMRLLVVLTMFRRQARDWLLENRIGYDRTESILNEGFRPEWHHFMPRSKARRLKDLKRKAKVTSLPGEDSDFGANSLANIVVLNEKANRSFSSNLPAAYIDKYHVDTSRLEEQLIPLDRRLWTLDGFGEFLAVRAKALADECNKTLARLRAGEPV